MIAILDLCKLVKLPKVVFWQQTMLQEAMGVQIKQKVHTIKYFYVQHLMYKQVAMTSQNSMVTNYTLPCCRSSYVWHVKQSLSIAISRHSNRLALLDSEHRLQILQQT